MKTGPIKGFKMIRSYVRFNFTITLEGSTRRSLDFSILRHILLLGYNVLRITARLVSQRARARVDRDNIYLNIRFPTLCMNIIR